MRYYINKEKPIQELINTYLSDLAVEEFDEIVMLAEKRKLRNRLLTLTAGLAAAASLALAVMFSGNTPARQEQIRTIDIAEGINMLMGLNIGDVESITAVPTGVTALLTAKMKDGSTYSYILVRDAEDKGTLSLLAMH